MSEERGRSHGASGMQARTLVQGPMAVYPDLSDAG